MAGTNTGDDAGRDGAGRDDEIQDAEVEERWADIVARLGDVAPAVDADGPEQDEPRPAAPDASPTSQADPAAHVVAPVQGPRDWPVTPEVEALEEAESHFTPPDPGPVLTSRDPLLTLGWAGAAGVPLLAVVALVVRSLVPALHIPGWVAPAAGLVFLAGVAVLLWRMPQHRDPSDHDDGAVV
ncbi:hypothetical protein [Xylanimonas oleitrophica]|uniref:hypothetical protein n=1 Tax=Xylanimonas oleitrophica TaxID=2607479 RepID=UPI0011B6452E|nr:hypothetical protein [Xylanimonas oleitrophica]